MFLERTHAVSPKTARREEPPAPATGDARPLAPRDPSGWVPRKLAGILTVECDTFGQ